MKNSTRKNVKKFIYHLTSIRHRIAELFFLFHDLSHVTLAVVVVSTLLAYLLLVWAIKTGGLYWRRTSVREGRTASVVRQYLFCCWDL